MQQPEMIKAESTSKVMDDDDDEEKKTNKKRKRDHQSNKEQAKMSYKLVYTDE